MEERSGEGGIEFTDAREDGSFFRVEAFHRHGEVGRAECESDDSAVELDGEFGEAGGEMAELARRGSGGDGAFHGGILG